MKKGPYMVAYDRTDEERITGLEFGLVKTGTSSQDIAVWIWNKKNFSDAPMAVDVRVSAIAANAGAVSLIENDCLKIRSNGIKDPDGAGIVDDEENVFSSIGGGLLENGDYHSIGDIPSNCARRLIVRIDLPLDFGVSGIPRFKLQVGCMSGNLKWLYVADEVE